MAKAKPKRASAKRKKPARKAAKAKAPAHALSQKSSQAKWVYAFGGGRA
jgi:hypothetical protein